MDFSKYQFRCSSLPKLMTKSRSKTDPLSETAKAYLKEIYIAEVYGREKIDTSTKFTMKGTACESDSLDLVKAVTGKIYFKNKKQLSNEWIKGTPDVIGSDFIIDIKTSWDIWTFSGVDERKAFRDYYYQLIGYMWLTGKTKAELNYCLVNTPSDIMESELYRLSFKYPELANGGEEYEAAVKNFIYDDIDPKLRLKRFTFEFSELEATSIRVRLEASREFLNGLSL